MPRADPAGYRSMPLQVWPLVDGFELHDVWRIRLEGAATLTITELRALIDTGSRRRVNPAVRLLFGVRSWLGRVFALDGPRTGPRLADRVATDLAARSLDPPGTPAGPFTTLFALDEESAYEARNATVHAVLSVVLVHDDAGCTLCWGTWVRPVGRITAVYMALIDPFRRWIVYPGLESWLVRAVRERRRPPT